MMSIRGSQDYGQLQYCRSFLLLKIMARIFTEGGTFICKITRISFFTKRMGVPYLSASHCQYLNWFILQNRERIIKKEKKGNITFPQESKTIFLVISGFNRDLLLLMVRFTCDNSLTDGTLVAGIDKYFLANKDNVGESFSCCFQNLGSLVAYKPS